MKKVLIIITLLTISFSSFSQSEKYMATMKANIAAIDSNFTNPTGMQALANKFERIATAEKTQWLAYYYAALCQVNYAYGILEKDKSGLDAIADKASDLIAKADSLMPGNSENSCVKSMIATVHIMVDPMNRFMQYGQESSDELDAASKQDATNPRPNMLRGTTLKFTPEQFGGGCSTAKPELQTALNKFAKFLPASEIHPNWGKQRVELLIKDCK